jgi:hypothetical protein
MTLRDLTSDLHHACEAHPVGQRMTAGRVTAQEWADWLWAMLALHQWADIGLPLHMHREGPLLSDLRVLPQARPSRAAMAFAATLGRQGNGGVAYVLHGAHRSGGRVLAPSMAEAGLPTLHVFYSDQAGAQEWLKRARLQVEWAEQARATFACLLAVMDEIEGERA